MVQRAQTYYLLLLLVLARLRANAYDANAVDRTGNALSTVIVLGSVFTHRYKYVIFYHFYYFYTCLDYNITEVYKKVYSLFLEHIYVSHFCKNCPVNSQIFMLRI